MTDAVEAAARAAYERFGLFWYEATVGARAMFLEDAKAAITAYLAAQWQPIETAPKMRKIIVTYVNEARKRRTVMACYYEDHSLEMHDDYADVGAYDEATGDSYAPAGWYEEIDHEGDIYALGGEPDYWQPLPEPPATDDALAGPRARA